MGPARFYGCPVRDPRALPWGVLLGRQGQGAWTTEPIAVTKRVLRMAAGRRVDLLLHGPPQTGRNQACAVVPLDVAACRGCCSIPGPRGNPDAVWFHPVIHSRVVTLDPYVVTDIKAKSFNASLQNS